MRKGFNGFRPRTQLSNVKSRNISNSVINKDNLNNNNTKNNKENINNNKNNNLPNSTKNDNNGNNNDSDNDDDDDNRNDNNTNKNNNNNNNHNNMFINTIVLAEEGSGEGEIYYLVKVVVLPPRPMLITKDQGLKSFFILQLYNFFYI